MWMKYHLRVCSSSASCCRNPGFGRTFRANDMNLGSECRFSNMALTFILRKFFDTYLSSLGDHIQGLSEYAITDEGKGKLKRFASALFSCWKAYYSVIITLIKHVDDIVTCLQVMFCFIMTTVADLSCSMRTITKIFTLTLNWEAGRPFIRYIVNIDNSNTQLFDVRVFRNWVVQF